MKYGFIGCGNMGGAVAKALAQSTKDIAITDHSGKGRALAERLGIAYTDAETIVKECDCVFLAVKPQMMAGVLTPLVPVFQEKKPLVVTMAAGLTMERIAELAGGNLPVIRMMPNTPVAVGKGMIQYCANSLVTDGQLNTWLADMAPCGRLDELGEHLIDAASALSGCGPAYMYIFLEALADGAVACGIPRAKAMEYAAATMVGAAEMVLTSGQHPGALKDAVCSPGGSTIQGVKALENHGLRAAAIAAVEAACEKNKQLGK